MPTRRLSVRQQDAPPASKGKEGKAKKPAAAGDNKEKEEKEGGGLPTEAVTGALGGATKGLPADGLLLGGLPVVNGLPATGALPVVGDLATTCLPTDSITELAGGVTKGGLPTDGVTGIARSDLPTKKVTGLAKGLPGVDGVASGL